MTIIKNLDPVMRPERVSSRLHSIGAFAGIIVFPFLLYHASISSAKNSLLSAIVYGLTFILTFTLSSLFHKSTSQQKRKFYKILDRISIYFLIAGTYTPIVNYYMRSNTGTVLLIALWSLVGFGVIFELYLVKRFILISVPLYILMGCLFVFTAGKFFAGMPGQIMVLVLSGIILYLGGVIFYLREKWEYNHAIWHIFVLLAASCHYAAILLTVMRS